MSKSQQKPTAMQYAVPGGGPAKVVMPAYKEAYGNGDLPWDYKNGKADCDLLLQFLEKW